MPDPQAQPSPGASAALNSPAAGGDFMKALTQQDEKTQAIVGQEQKEMAPAMDQANMALNQPRPQAPQLQTAPAMPDFQAELHKNGEEFVLTSTLIAGLVGAFTRSHVTTALNAFGAAVKGFHQGQLEAADQSFKEWKANSDAVEKNNQNLLAQYKAVFEDRKASIDEASNRIALIAAKYKDPLMAQAASAKNMGMMAQLYERLTDANNRFVIANDKLEDMREKWQDSLKDATDASGIDPKTPEGQQKLAQLSVKNPKAAKSFIDAYKFTHPDEASKIDDAGLDYAATQYRINGTLPGLGMGGMDMKAKIINRAAQQASDLNQSPQDVAVNQATVKADKQALGQVTKYRAMVESFEQTAEKSSNLIRTLAPKGIGPSGVPVFDKWLQAGRKATGDADVVAFSNAIDTYTSEYSKIMSGATGAAAATDAAMAKAEGLINSAQTWGQLDAALRTMDKEMKFRLQSLHDEESSLRESIRGAGNSPPGVAPPADSGAGGGDVIKYDVQGKRIQ